MDKSEERELEKQKKRYIMALDAGTTSNRCILFDKSGKIVSMAQKEFTQIFPQPGWVEHDANEIWSTQLGVAVERCQDQCDGRGYRSYWNYEPAGDNDHLG